MANVSLGIFLEGKLFHVLDTRDKEKCHGIYSGN